MSIKVDWKCQSEFSITTENGFKLHADAESKKAPCPTEILLVALGSCSATDVVYALKEQEVEIRLFCSEVVFQLTDSSSRLYKSVNLHFIVEAAGVTEEQILQAAKDTVNKYCHVCLMLQPNIHITYTCDVV